jgi:xanthine dehydrogenase accessory factor
MRKILVLGVGDIGSAVAHRLFRAGHLVAIQDAPHPVTSRRRMAFSEAMFEHETQLTGVIARLIRPSALSAATWTFRFVPVTSASLDLAIERLAPDVIVDARMRKRAIPESLRRRGRLAIGLGPGFVAGDNVDVAIETSWDNLGRILRRGPTLPFNGEPRAINGHARDRYVYAPRAGVFSSDREIGDAVKRGEPIAKIGRQSIKAPLAGRLRGLSRAGLRVTKGAKVVEVVPSGSAEKVAGIGERPGRIAASVLTLVRELRD